MIYSGEVGASCVPVPKQLEAGKVAATKDLVHIPMSSKTKKTKNKYRPRKKEGVEFMKIKQQKKINVIYPFQSF